MVGLVSGEKTGLMEEWRGGVWGGWWQDVMELVANLSSGHCWTLEAPICWWRVKGAGTETAHKKKGRYRKKVGTSQNSSAPHWAIILSVYMYILYDLPPLHTLDPSVLIRRWRTAKSVGLTDSTSVRRIDLRSLVRGGGIGVGVCLSQTGRWRAVSDMQSHSQRPLWGGTGWGHPSLYITFSRKDIKPEG